MSFVDKILNTFKLSETKTTHRTSALSTTDNLTKAKTIYFRNGQLYKLDPPNSFSWYDAKFLVSNGKKYDLESIYDLHRLPIPTFDSIDILNGYGITGSLEYVLKMKAANLRNKGLIKESDCLYKRIHLFLAASGNNYRSKDYLDYSHILLTECKLEKYEQEKQFINEYLKTIPNKPFELLDRKKLLDQILENCEKWHTDYVVIDAFCGCCAECNKLQGRVYSISGKSKIFPKLPDHIREYGCIHPGCRHFISVYFFDSNVKNTIHDKFGHDVDAIQASQRPYIDDRSTAEKEAYLNYLKQKENERQKEIDELEYYTILAKLPDIAPKSFGGYRRMKNQQTKNYLKIEKVAKENGIKISERLEK